MRIKFLHKSVKNFFLIFSLSLSLIAQGCGYRFGEGVLPSKYRTVAIPYVLGDNTGELTATLIKEIAKSGAFEYRKSGTDLLLQVAIVDLYEENVGFRFDRDKEGKKTRSIIPTETRITAVAEVTVVECCSGCTVLGPARLNASVVFDHDYYFGSFQTNKFSLGQLTDYDAAYDAVQRPLNHALANKIVDYVVNSW